MMVNTEQDLRMLLGSSLSEQQKIMSTPIEGTGQTALCIEVHTHALALWEHLKNLVPTTQRWPVWIITNWNPQATISQEELASDIFSRFYFEEEEKDERLSDSPLDIIQAAQGLYVDDLLIKINSDEGLSAEEYLKIAIEQTQRKFGICPKIGHAQQFLQTHALQTVIDVERWFFDWEIEHCPHALELQENDLLHINWFEPSSYEHEAIVLLPTPHGWEAPAYINWFASYRKNSQLIVALLKEWEEKYGAQLVCHFGTMLQFITAKRPKTPAEAFHLAWQQYMIAPCTILLPGISLREHARALMHTNRWFLHERP